jgi:hydrogenase maturation protease
MNRKMETAMHTAACPISKHSPGDCLSAVFGLGSPHGDDTIGWLVARELEGRVSRGVRIREIAAPAQILDHLEGVGKLVLIDGCRMGLPPGTVVRFEWPHAVFQDSRPASTHGLGLAEMLHLASMVGRLPACVTLFGVEIVHADAGAAVSAKVIESLPILVTEVLEELSETKSRASR